MLAACAHHCRLTGQGPTHCPVYWAGVFENLRDQRLRQTCTCMLIIMAGTLYLSPLLSIVRHFYHLPVQPVAYFCCRR